MLPASLFWYYIMVPISMKKRHRATLELIYARPVSGSIRWVDIEAMFVALGADVTEREGSRIGVVLFGEVRVFPSPTSIARYGQGCGRQHSKMA